ncbi:hypothetical protein B0T25DRAFT_89328 [Lasiosphaeria hispida]|uniref:Uncharacterized protein n=1 Tax=Lasiosphaeria hispida TaxID=260671 RepID=A0AAJ0HPX7_9PEZI|nr:hypothetical protein B0T25DRAFT_89328 [Lasiosphaeria hispida]
MRLFITHVACHTRRSLQIASTAWFRCFEAIFTIFGEGSLQSISPLHVLGQFPCCLGHRRYMRRHAMPCDTIFCSALVKPTWPGLTRGYFWPPAPCVSALVPRHSMPNPPLARGRRCILAVSNGVLGAICAFAFFSFLSLFSSSLRQLAKVRLSSCPPLGEVQRRRSNLQVRRSISDTVGTLIGYVSTPRISCGVGDISCMGETDGDTLTSDYLGDVTKSGHAIESV